MNENIRLVKFRDGKFGIRREERDGSFSFLDICDAIGGKSGDEQKFVNWHWLDEDSFQPGGDCFEFCQADTLEQAQQALEFCLKWPEGATEDFGEVLLGDGSPVPEITEEDAEKMGEIMQIELEFAEEHARGIIDSATLPGVDKDSGLWNNTEVDSIRDRENIAKAVKYLQHYRLLEVHPTRPELVRIKAAP